MKKKKEILMEFFKYKINNSNNSISKEVFNNLFLMIENTKSDSYIINLVYDVYCEKINYEKINYEKINGKKIK